MFKIILQSFFIFFTVLFSGVLKSASYDSGLLWEIENVSGQKSILFGTMHCIDDEILSVFEIVKKYMVKANSISVEYVQQDEEDIRIIEDFLYRKDKHIKSYFTENEYEKLLKLLKLKNIPLNEIEYSSPYYIISLIMDPKLTIEPHMDALIESYAIDNSIKLIGLESVKSAFNSETNFDDNAYFLEQIRMAINAPSTIDDARQKFKTLYIEENLVQLNMLTEKDFFEHEVTRRNKIMIDNISKVIDEGNAFIAIGAGHLAGDEGVLNLLSKSGYKISRVALYP